VQKLSPSQQALAVEPLQSLRLPRPALKPKSAIREGAGAMDIGACLAIVGPEAAASPRDHGSVEARATAQKAAAAIRDDFVVWLVNMADSLVGLGLVVFMIDPGISWLSMSHFYEPARWTGVAPT
jgi:hypothetical protein